MYSVICAAVILSLVASAGLGQPRLEILPAVTSSTGTANLSADGQLATIAVSAGVSGGYNLTQWTPGGVTTHNGLYADHGQLIPTAGSRNGQYIVGNVGTQVFISSLDPAQSFSMAASATGVGFLPQCVSENGQYIAGASYRLSGPSSSSVFRTTVGNGATQFGPDNSTNYPTRLTRHGVADNGVVTGTFLTSLAGHGQSFRFDGGSFSVLRSGLIADAVWVAQDGSAIIDSINFGTMSLWTRDGGGTNVSQPFGSATTNGNSAVLSLNALTIATTNNVTGLTIWQNGGVGGTWTNTPFSAWLASAGVDTTGWTFDFAYDLTDDGRTILGSGTYLGSPATFVTYGVPAPSAAGVFGLLTVLACRRRR